MSPHQVFLSHRASLLARILTGAILLMLLILVTTSGQTTSADAAPLVAGDEKWASNFSIEGVSGPVDALAITPDRRLIYVGGEFTAAGAVGAKNIASWNPSGWSNLGYGLYGGSVRALAVYGSEIYVGGGFYRICNDTPCWDITVANYIAMWNGTSWSALGNGLHGSVEAIVVDTASGAIYVGGTFDAVCGSYACNSGNTPMFHVAKWDRVSKSWSPVGYGLYGNVYALALYGGNLYAGGSFTGYCANETCSSHPMAFRVAQWTGGATWSPFERGMDDTVRALAVDSAGHIYAGGDFHTLTGSPTTVVNHIAKYVSGAWHALDFGLGGPVRSLAVDTPGNLYVGGTFTQICWSVTCSPGTGTPVKRVVKYPANSATPVPIEPGFDSLTIPMLGVNALLANPVSGSVYAGGEFERAGDVGAKHIARWNGTSWVSLGYSSDGMSAAVRAIATDENGNTFAGGDFDVAGRAITHGVAKWNASTVTWSAVGTGWSQPISLLAADRSGGVYAAAGWGIWHWNAATGWTSIPDHPNGAIYALVVDGNHDLYVGGQFTHICNANCTTNILRVNDIARWDGAAWHSVGNGFQGASVNSLAFDYQGRLYAGGNFTNVCNNMDCTGVTPANHVARYDGTWVPLGLGVKGNVTAIAADAEGNVYVGGSFGFLCGDTACATFGALVSNIARWNGSAWSPLRYGIHPWSSNVVNALIVDGAGILYAGGAFLDTCGNANCSAPGIWVNNIAAWDGSDWSALGSGTNGAVLTMAMDARGYLNAGGEFTVAGGKASVFFGRFDLRQWSYLPLLMR